MLKFLLLTFLILAFSDLGQTDDCYNGKWTEWFNLDHPNDGGEDSEILWDLISQFQGSPDVICNNPTQIEAQTTNGQPAETTGEVFFFYSIHIGFLCINSEQSDGICLDYKVRFCCPLPDPCSSNPCVNEGTCVRSGSVFTCVCKEGYTGDRCEIQLNVCSGDFEWTQWFDRDDPSGFADAEVLSHLRVEFPNGGISNGGICDNPTAIEAQTLTGQPAETTGQIFVGYNTVFGFQCDNSDQPDGQCLDYKVRFCCPVCSDEDWTSWFDRDSPSDGVDDETLWSLRLDYPSICLSPDGIEAKTTSGQPAETTGETFRYYDTRIGFLCFNYDQQDGSCLDYQVRFCCP